jgi:integrase
MASVTKRGNKWYVHFKDCTGKEVQRTTVATTKTEAKEIARELERVAWRQRNGLDALPTQSVKFGTLLDWWRELYRARSRAYSKDQYLKFLDQHLAEFHDFELSPSTTGKFAEALDALLREREAVRGFAARTVNHIRSAVHNIFETARHPKYRRWIGENPVQWVERRTVRRAKRETLAREEVPHVLAALPEPSLAHPWRWVVALLLYTGARPGEAFGLRKEDVDTATWVMTIRSSWTNPVPKDDEERLVLVPPELRPLITAAMEASPSEYVFCRADGAPFDPSIRHGLVDNLRRALGRAGIVSGYRYSCRRKGCGYKVEQQKRWLTPDQPRGPCCPTCGMRLWESPIPRKLRTYDLRHTHGTLLRKAGVDIGAVSKRLGHSSPEITAQIYDHSGVEDFREQFDRALSFGVGQPFHAPAMQSGGGWKDKAPGAAAFANESEGFESGRQDLNLRPLGPEPSRAASHVPHGEAPGRNRLIFLHRPRSRIGHPSHREHAGCSPWLQNGCNADST